MGVPGAVAEVAAAEQVVVGVDIEAVRARPGSRAPHGTLMASGDALVLP